MCGEGLIKAGTTQSYQGRATARSCSGEEHPCLWDERFEHACSICSSAFNASVVGPIERRLCLYTGHGGQIMLQLFIHAAILLPPTLAANFRPVDPMGK